MNTRFAVPAALAALALLFQCGCRTGGDRMVASRLDAFFTDLHERGLFDGAVVVGRSDRIVWEKGFGYADAARGVPFTPSTATDGASLAKTFTAALLVMLAHDGVLRLDDPAQRYLPELPYPDVTLRHLLSHTSGIPIHGYEDFDPFIPPDQIRTTDRLLSVLAMRNLPLTALPGTSFEYSSFGYDLAALAAARAASKPYGDLLRDRIFRPFGLDSAFVRPGRLHEFPGIRTLGYRRAGGTLEPHDVFDFEAFHGGSNIYISARDLYRWSSLFFDERLFTRAQLAELTSFARVGENPSNLTLGSWYRTEDGAAFWYSGHLEGFHSEVFRDLRSQWSIVYTSNNTIEPWLQKGVIRAVNQVIAGRPPALTRPVTDRIAREDRRRLAGRWILSGGELLTIEDRDGLRVIKSGVAYPMFPEGTSFLYVPGLDLILGFAKGADGQISNVDVSSNVVEKWGSREAR